MVAHSDRQRPVTQPGPISSSTGPRPARPASQPCSPGFSYHLPGGLAAGRGFPAGFGRSSGSPASPPAGPRLETEEIDAPEDELAPAGDHPHHGPGYRGLPRPDCLPAEAFPDPHLERHPSTALTAPVPAERRPRFWNVSSAGRRRTAAGRRLTFGRTRPPTVRSRTSTSFAHRARQMTAQGRRPWWGCRLGARRLGSRRRSRTARAVLAERRPGCGCPAPPRVEGLGYDVAGKTSRGRPTRSQPVQPRPRNRLLLVVVLRSLQDRPHVMLGAGPRGPDSSSPLPRLWRWP